jgi:hypothetical protein
LELEDMVVRLVRRPNLASVHGYRWTVRLGISVDVRCLADGISGWVQHRKCLAGMLLAIRVSTSLQLTVGV